MFGLSAFRCRKRATLSPIQRHGVEMVKKALSWPARQIAINAGEDGSLIVGKIQDSDTYAFGFDAQSGKFVVEGDHRPDQGRPHGPARCGLNCGLAHHYRGDGSRSAEKAIAGACHARWWHGRHGLLIDTNQCYRQEGSGECSGPFP